MKAKVKKALLETIKALYSTEINGFSLEPPREESYGDYATNVAFLLAKSLRKNPQEIAQEIANKLSNEGLSAEALKGFINIRLKEGFLQEEFSRLFKEGSSYFFEPVERPLYMQVEFVSANPTGPLHVGHGRGAVVGDVLSRILKRFGHKVVREYYIDLDASLVEINPLVLTKEGNLILLDAKVELDDNALIRHKDLEELEDLTQLDPLEVEAKKYSLNYIKLDGNIGCMVNGAGLAMTTMDIIKLAGGEPANFLDVGGGANVEQIANAFRILMADPNVKAVFINIFGGILRCDRLANGLIEAAKMVEIKVPVVVRMEGTNVEEGRKILAESGLNFINAVDMWDGAQKAVALASKGG